MHRASWMLMEGMSMLEGTSCTREGNQHLDTTTTAAAKTSKLREVVTLDRMEKHRELVC